MTEKWWHDKIAYQIYPKSFQDTTGSGTGDIQGVIQRLDYLANLGVDALWLTPFYPSPQVDNGYDVADYLDVDPAFGTLEDVDCLIAEAHQRGHCGRRNLAARRLAEQADQHGGDENGEQRHKDRHGVLREFALGGSKKNHGGNGCGVGRRAF